MSITSALLQPSADVASRRSARTQALAAILLGLFLVWMAGFSHSDVLHNAAHDTRHSAGMPCH